MREIDDFANEDNIFYDRKADKAFLERFIRICRNGLTEREIDVYQMRKDNYSHSEIAEALGISAKTSRNHYSSALAKMKMWTDGNITKKQ